MDVIKQLIERASQERQRIVLPEGTEERTLKAADKAIADGIADLIILGNKTEIENLAQKFELKNIERATIIDPENNPDAEKYATLLYELRKAKGMTMEDAQKLVCTPLYLGCLIIKNGDADGQVAGAENTTGNVLRPALQIIKTTPGITCVSGCMMMITNANAISKTKSSNLGIMSSTHSPNLLISSFTSAASFISMAASDTHKSFFNEVSSLCVETLSKHFYKFFF